MMPVARLHIASAFARGTDDMSSACRAQLCGSRKSLSTSTQSPKADLTRLSKIWEPSAPSPMATILIGFGTVSPRVAAVWLFSMNVGRIGRISTFAASSVRTSGFPRMTPEKPLTGCGSSTPSATPSSWIVARETKSHVSWDSGFSPVWRRFGKSRQNMICDLEKRSVSGPVFQARRRSRTDCNRSRETLWQNW